MWVNKGNLHFKLGTHFFFFIQPSGLNRAVIFPVEWFVFRWGGGAALPEHTDEPSQLLAASTDWILVSTMFFQPGSVHMNQKYSGEAILWLLSTRIFREMVLAFPQLIRHKNGVGEWLPLSEFYRCVLCPPIEQLLHRLTQSLYANARSAFILPIKKNYSSLR